MQNSSNFYDIMPFVTIQIDILPYIYILVSIVIAVYLLKIFIKKAFLKKEPTLTHKEMILQKIKQLDFNSSNQKQVLYDFTLLTQELDELKDDKNLQKILQAIKPYKYQAKDVQIPKELKSEIKRYVDESLFVISTAKLSDTPK